MKRISSEDFTRLVQIHNPVEFEKKDIDYAEKFYSFVNSLSRLSVYTKEKKLKLEEAIEEAGFEGEVTLDNLRSVHKEQEERMETELSSIVGSYHGMHTADNGGYILPPRPLIRPFIDKVINHGAGTGMKIIESNRYRAYDEQHFMLREMVSNAYEHGNRYDPEKKVLFLWHRCGNARQILLIDEGESEFDFAEAHQRRINLAGAFGKDDFSGFDLLISESRSFDFYRIGDESRVGTLLRIDLDKVEKCGYIGHEIL